MRAELINSDPCVMMGKPVIAGTRITVELILEKLGAGETVEQILEAHPRLTREAIKANAGIRRQSIAGRRCLPYKQDKLMNFLADEGVDFPVVQRHCRRLGKKIRLL